MAPFIQVINLARAPERRARMERQFHALGLDVAFVSGVDGTLVDRQVLEAHKSPFARAVRRPLSPTEIACALSHRRALSNIIEGGHPYGVVLEDDAELPADFARWIEDIERYPPGWGIIKLSGFRTYRPPFVKVAELETRDVLLSPNSSMGLAAYLITARAAIPLIRDLTRFGKPVDHIFGDQYRRGTRIYEIVPFPAGHAQTASTISGRFLPTKRSWALRKTDRWLWHLRQFVGRRWFLVREAGLAALPTLIEIDRKPKPAPQPKPRAASR